MGVIINIPPIIVSIIIFAVVLSSTFQCVAKIFCAPALPLKEVVDPTGAGDSFIGGFAGYLSQCGRITFEEMKTATVMGSAMASFTVQKFGTESLQAITPERLKQRIQAFKTLTKFEIELT